MKEGDIVGCGGGVTEVTGGEGAARWIGLCRGEAKLGLGDAADVEALTAEEDECCRGCCGKGGTGGAVSDDAKTVFLRDEAEDGDGERDPFGEVLLSGMAGIASDKRPGCCCWAVSLRSSSISDVFERDSQPKALLRLFPLVVLSPLVEMMLMLSVLLRLVKLGAYPCRPGDIGGFAPPPTLDIRFSRFARTFGSIGMGGRFSSPLLRVERIE